MDFGLSFHFGLSGGPPVVSLLSLDFESGLDFDMAQVHGWPSTQAEVKTEAKAHQGGTTLRPERSHSYIYIHALVI